MALRQEGDKQGNVEIVKEHATIVVLVFHCVFCRCIAYWLMYWSIQLHSCKSVNLLA